MTPAGNSGSSGATSILATEASLVTLVGNDRLDFLHRLSTNDILSLKPGGIRGTILTTEIGKIVDAVTLINRDNTTDIIGSRGNGGRLAEWIEKFVFSEDVAVKGVIPEFQVVTQVLVNQSGVEGGSIGSVNPGFLGNMTIEAESVEFYLNPYWRRPTYTILPGSLRINNLLESLTADIGHAGTILPDDFDLMRIEEGVPEFGKELTGEINPLEAGLHRFVSFSKGCYIGQEVIARLDTYKKLQKNLVRVIISHTDSGSLSLGSILDHDERVGWTTSLRYSERRRCWIALGYLKSAITGVELRYLPDDEHSTIPAVVEPLRTE